MCNFTMILKCIFLSFKYPRWGFLWLMLWVKLYFFSSYSYFKKDDSVDTQHWDFRLSLILLNIHLLNNSLFWSVSGRQTGIHSSYSNIWYLQKIFLACFSWTDMATYLVLWHWELNKDTESMNKYNFQILQTRSSSRTLLEGTIPPRMQCAQVILSIPTLYSYCLFCWVLGDQKDKNRMMYRDMWRQDYYSGHCTKQYTNEWYHAMTWNVMRWHGMWWDTTQHNMTHTIQWNTKDVEGQLSSFLIDAHPWFLSLEQTGSMRWRSIFPAFFYDVNMSKILAFLSQIPMTLVNW